MLTWEVPSDGDAVRRDRVGTGIPPDSPFPSRNVPGNPDPLPTALAPHPDLRNGNEVGEVFHLLRSLDGGGVREGLLLETPDLVVGPHRVRQVCPGQRLHDPLECQTGILVPREHEVFHHQLEPGGVRDGLGVGVEVKRVHDANRGPDLRAHGTVLLRDLDDFHAGLRDDPAVDAPHAETRPGERVRLDPLDEKVAEPGADGVGLGVAVYPFHVAGVDLKEIC